MSIIQDQLFREALHCVANGLYRAAHVMAWAGFMDYLENKVDQQNIVKLQQRRPNWKLKRVEDFREHVPEYQLIEAFSDIGFVTKNEKKALLGLLNKRNECAHPSSYTPGLNETLGFISELFNRIEMLTYRTF